MPHNDPDAEHDLRPFAGHHLVASRAFPEPRGSTHEPRLKDAIAPAQDDGLMYVRSVSRPAADRSASAPKLGSPRPTRT